MPSGRRGSSPARGSDHPHRVSLHKLPADGGRVLARAQGEPEEDVPLLETGIDVRQEGHGPGHAGVGDPDELRGGREVLRFDPELPEECPRGIGVRDGRLMDPRPGHEQPDLCPFPPHLEDGGPQVFRGHPILPPVCEDEPVTRGRSVKRNPPSAPPGEEGVEEERLEGRDEHREEARGERPERPRIITRMPVQVVEHGPLEGQANGKMAEGLLCIPSLEVRLPGLADLCRFGGKGCPQIGEDRTLEVAPEDSLTYQVGDRADDPESLDADIVREAGRTRTSHFFHPGGKVRRFAFPDPDEEAVPPQLSEGNRVVGPTGHLEGDPGEGDSLQGLRRDAMDGDVLGGHGPPILGAGPRDPAVADPKDPGEILHEALLLPVPLRQPEDEVLAAFLPRLRGQLIDPEVLRLPPEVSPDTLRPGRVPRNPEPLFEGIRGLPHRSGRSEVIRSISSLRAGPRPRAVVVPGGTSVRPASWISAAAIPRASAMVFSSRRLRSSFTFSTTFFCPSASHRSRVSRSHRSKAATAAWAAWAEILPQLIRISPRITRHCFHRNSRSPGEVMNPDSLSAGANFRPHRWTILILSMARM